jgi:hypothetical protein
MPLKQRLLGQLTARETTMATPPWGDRETLELSDYSGTQIQKNPPPRHIDEST